MNTYKFHVNTGSVYKIGYTFYINGKDKEDAYNRLYKYLYQHDFVLYDILKCKVSKLTYRDTYRIGFK